MTQGFPPPMEQKPSAAKKWVIGCGIGCFVVLILVGILAAAGYWGFRKVMQKVDAMAAGFEEQGFSRVTDHMIDVNDPVTQPTVYVGQIVRLFADCDSDVAIIGQMAEVHGAVKGDLHFRGQMLTLQPSAVLYGNVDAQAQMVQVNRAIVLGEITGSSQVVDNGMRRQLE